MLFKDVKDGEFFYFGSSLFIKNNEIKNQTIPFGSLERDSVYMTNYIGYPCCIGDNADVVLADVEIKHKPRKTYEDIPIGGKFKLDGYNFIKLSGKEAVRNPTIEHISPTTVVE